MFVIAASLHTIMTNSYTYSVLPVFPFDSVWLLDLHPNVQDLKTVSLRYMAFLEGTSMKFSTWNLAMWARIPKISPQNPSAMTHHKIAPLVQFQAYMWFGEGFKDPLKLVLNFCMCNSATALHIIRNQLMKFGPPMPTTGANGSVWQFPATNQTIFWGPATHGSIQGQSCLRTEYQTGNVSFKPKSKTWDFKIKAERTANLSSKFEVFTKCSQKIL